MSLSIDKDLGEQGENAREVLAGWLDGYIAGRCDRADMQAQFLSVCRSNPDAPWDALALLDQYQRRGRIDVALARSLKTDIAQLVFGVANQTEPKSDAPQNDFTATDVTIDTTGSRWRKLLAERDPDSINSEPAFVDPTLLRHKEDDAPTRPPPVLKLDEQEPAPVVPEEQTSDLRAASLTRERPARPSAPVAPAGLSSDVLRDRYELVAILGRGSTGTVYKAVDRHRTHLDPGSRCVAVKVLKQNYHDRPDELAQLEREFHQAQSLSHPNIVSVFDLDRDGNVYFIVMELLEGELLADILKRLDGKPMSRHFALSIVSSVGAALTYAHKREVVHADLKPRNIMITTAGELRVLDFGFARERPLDMHITAGFQDAPTTAPAYASVERVNGSEPHPSDDVYSLACIAYELLSGRHPFGGRSAPLARAHGRQPQKVPGLTSKQQATLQRALLWSRGESRIDVVEFLNGLGCGEAPPRLGLPQEIGTGSGGAGWRRSAIALSLLFILAAGTYFVWQYGLLPKNLANVLPVTFPIGDRELQSESPGAPVANQTPPLKTEAVEVPATLPPAAIQSPAVEAPKEDSPKQTSQQPTVPVETNAAPSRRQQAQPSRTETPRVETPRETSKAASAPTTAVENEQAPARQRQTSGSAKPVTIEFDKDSYVVTEGEGYVRLQIRRTGPLRREVSFTWNLRSNSADAGSDFAAIGPGTERMAPGVRETTITIPLVQDSLKESTELFLVELQVDEEGVVLGERSSAAVIIVDDD